MKILMSLAVLCLVSVAQANNYSSARDCVSGERAKGWDESGARIMCGYSPSVRNCANNAWVKPGNGNWAAAQNRALSACGGGSYSRSYSR